MIRWLPFGRAPERDVYLPKRYAERIEALYAEVYLARRISPSDGRIGDEDTVLEQAYDERRQTLRIAISRTGNDLGAKVSAERLRATDRGGLIVHVDLRLGDSATPAGVGILRDLGFSFAGLLPEYRDGDVLRMQWLSDRVGESATGVLSTEAGREIEAFVLEDRAAGAA